MRVFSAADKRNRKFIRQDQFNFALVKLRLIVAREALKKAGLTLEDMLTGLVLSMIFLLTLFAFIFVGISAFSFANPFGAVINAILPASAGVNVSKEEEE